MYGLLNAALKQLIVSKHGAATWDAIGARAGVGPEPFKKMEPYPDELTYQLVGAASSVIGTPVDTLLDAFGEFWVSYTDEQGYGALFDIAGDSLRDFLLSLDALHVRVGRSFPKLKPPSFRFDTVDSGTLRMHYLSTRKNLCPMVFGLVRGLSRRFKTPVTVREDACSRKGADHCEFILVFP